MSSRYLVIHETFDLQKPGPGRGLSCIYVYSTSNLQEANTVTKRINNNQDEWGELAYGCYVIDLDNQADVRPLQQLIDELDEYDENMRETP
ncbi:MAG: hypothetical protein GEU78_15035 [Actinobacteria bacterium]|nr:hypothetical protein [Actinomycetota bacterium]